MTNNLRKIAIAGSTGSIGSALCEGFSKINSTVIPILRKNNDNNSLNLEQIEKGYFPNNIDVLINVCGLNIFKTIKFCENEIFESRIKPNLILKNAIINCEKPPHTFITISGVGLYKADNSIVHDESSTKFQNDFWDKLINEWENASLLPNNIKTRRVVIRSGVVLDRKNGMIKKMYPQFYLGFGGWLGNGKNYMPWIHISDLIRLFIFCAKNSFIEGNVIATAPELITNKHFCKIFAKKLNRPCFFFLPENIIKLIYGVERKNLLLNSVKVYPKKILDAGFIFEYPDIESSCDNLIKMKI